MRRNRGAVFIAIFAALSISVGSAAQATPATGASGIAAGARFVAVSPGVCSINVPTKGPNDQRVPGYDEDRAGAACSQLLLSFGTEAGGLGALPKVGQQAELKVTVASDANQPPGSAPLAVSVPNGLRFSAVPEGFTSETAGGPFGFDAGGKTKGDGSAAGVARGDVVLDPGGSVSVLFTVEVETAGAGNIEASLNDPVGGPGSNKSIAFTYSADAATEGTETPDLLEAQEVTAPVTVIAAPKYTSKSGLCPGGTPVGKRAFCPGVDSLLEVVQPASTSSAKTNKARARSAASSNAGKPTGRRVTALATTCVIGRMVYADQSGVVRPSVNLPVVAVDDNPLDSDRVGSQVTDGDGRFNMCFNNEEHSILQDGTADVKLTFKTQNQRWRVVNRCCSSGLTPGAYEITTARHDDVPAGTVDFGTMTVSNGNFQRALHLYDTYNRGWQFANSHSPNAGTCWAATDCDQKTVMWENGYADNWPAYGTCGLRTDSIVCLPANTPDWEPVVLHELGHDLMDEIYPGGIPDHDCPNPHAGTAAEQDRCAWTEGWPSWFSNAVMDSPIDTGYGGQSAMFTTPADREKLGWQNYQTFVRGSNVEARVTSALWDLSDSANELPWDRTSLGVETLWRAFLSGTSTTLPDFVARLGATAGIDFGPSSPARSTLYGNTIDLGGSTFRDPLSTLWMDRPLPPVSPPSLSAIPMGSTASPVNSSNNHAFVWERPTRPSSCPDVVQVEDTWGSSVYYRATAGAPTFAYSGFGIDAFANAAATAGIGSSARVNLQRAGSLSLELPQTPRTVWITTRGAAPLPQPNSTSAGISHGDWTLPPLNHYRIRAARCSILQTGAPTTVEPTALLNSAVLLRAKVRYTITATPRGAAAAVKQTNISLELMQGKRCRTLAAARKCLFDRAPVATSDKHGLGKDEAVRFTPKTTGVYRVIGKTASGKPTGWRVKVTDKGKA